MDSNPKPDPLDGLLSTWTVDKTCGFESRVWQRIASSEAKRISGWRSFGELLDSCLLRPALAFSLCALFLAAGLSVGHVQVQARKQQGNQTLEKGYWRSVDPFQKVSMSQ